MANRLLGVLLTLAVLALGAFAYSVWSGQPLPTSALFDAPDAPDPDDRLWGDVRPGWHAALACPVGACGKGDGVIESPVFDLPARALYDLVRTYVLSQPHVVEVRDDPQGLRLDVVQRSAILGIPEMASLKIEADVGRGGSSLRLLSRSRFGAWGPGGNKARVSTWIGGIERAVRAASLSTSTEP